MKERATKEGKRFKELRHLTGLSQAQFAREVGVKVQNISRIEQGYTSIRNMTHERIEMLAYGFNVKPQSLIQYVMGDMTAREFYYNKQI